MQTRKNYYIFEINNTKHLKTNKKKVLPEIFSMSQKKIHAFLLISKFLFKSLIIRSNSISCQTIILFSSLNSFLLQIFLKIREVPEWCKLPSSFYECISLSIMLQLTMLPDVPLQLWMMTQIRSLKIFTVFTTPI